MDMFEREKLFIFIKIKFEKIKIFFVFFGGRVKDFIIMNIIDIVDEFLDKGVLFIDVLWRFIKGLESGDDKYIIIEVMNILG